jgi:hypothetical protein
MQTKTREIDVTVPPEQQRAETWLGEDVENAIEDGLGIGRDDITTLAETPRNRVQEPQRDGPDAAEGVDVGDVGADDAGVGAAFKDDCVGNEEEGRAAEGEVAPFVGGLDEGAAEASDDNDLVDEDGVGDCGGWEGAGQEEVLKRGLIEISFV